MIAFIVTAFATKATSLMFAGDIMLNGIRPGPAIFEAVRRMTAGSDASLANLEIPLTTASTRTQRKSVQELSAHNQWILKADPRHAPFIADSGITMVSLANNHAMDYGPAGLAQMSAELDRAKILHAGAGLNSNIAMRPAIEVLPSGKKLALLSVMGFMTQSALYKTTPATLTTPGIGVLNTGGVITAKVREKLANWIATARGLADFVVVGIHWGVERKNLPTPYQVALGRALIDAGADIVWGNHPHVLQGAELYKGRLIMYSVGNLISNLPAVTGVFQARIDENGKQQIAFIPARVTHGRVSFVETRLRRAEIGRMRSLCQLLLRRYPSPVSIPAL